MASADQQERNLVRQSGVVRYLPPKDNATTAVTRDAGLAGAFGPGSMYDFNNAQGSLTKQFTDTQTANMFGKPPMFGGTTPTGPKSTTDSMTSFITSLLGGGSGSGAKASDALARDKFNYEKQQDALKLGGMQKYYDSDATNTGFDALLKMIGDQGTVSENAVKKAYDAAITNVDQGYNAAQTLGTEGYADLNKYLTANQNDPYAGMQATVGSAPDALTQYLSAYGVSDQPVQGQIQADQLQAQQGAGNYQNLINLLSSVAQSGASSRGAESAMGQNLFNTTLGQERAGYKTKAEMAQADAMRQIQQIMYEQRLAQESARNSQMQQLAQALAAAGGNPGGGGGTTTGGTTTGGTTTGGTPIVPQRPTGSDIKLPPQQIVANQLANLLAPAQAQGTSAQQLLDELNARRGR